MLSPPQTPQNPSSTPVARRKAAVLVPIYDGPDGPILLLIRRTRTINHPGQVAFPGGRPEPADLSLLATALREAYEELGIEPAAVRIVAELPVVETLTSNYAISAFVGRLPARPPLRPQVSEVAAILDVPLSALLADHLPVQEEWEFEQERRTRTIRYFPWGEDKIWGATARMIEHLLAAVRAGQLVL